jgi:hypothetical protein
MSVPRALLRPLLLILLCAVAGVATATEVYRWKDANGVTQYGERPPEGIKAERMDVRAAPTPPPANAPESAQEPEPDTSGMSVDERAEAARKAAIEAAAEARLASREAACARAQQNSRVLRENDFVSLREGDQTRTLTAEEREAQIADNEAAVAEKCGPEPDGTGGG